MSDARPRETTARPDCPVCHGTGIAHRAPYLVGLKGGDLYTITLCACLSDANSEDAPDAR